MTPRSDQLVIVVTWLGLATLLGSLGFWLARPQTREGRRTTLVAAAIRFCLGGLVGAFLDAVILAGMFAYTRLF